MTDFCCAEGKSVVAVQDVRHHWHWYCLDHLSDAEAAINTLHMMHALELAGDP
jgi:hypothetical protein